MDAKTAKAVTLLLTKRGTPEGGHVMLARIITNDFAGLLNEHKLSLAESAEVRPDMMEVLNDLMWLRTTDTVTAKNAKEILLACWATPFLDPIDFLVQSKILDEVGGDALIGIVREVIAANPKVVETVQKGKTAAAGSLIGQVMKRVKADPKTVKMLIDQQLGI